jgi:hypothetical protein
MRPNTIQSSIAVWLIAAASASAESPDHNLEFLHALTLPGKNDSQWMNVSWLPATNIWEARQKAARDGKPILLWYMAGEPLGAC